MDLVVSFLLVPEPPRSWCFPAPAATPPCLWGKLFQRSEVGLGVGGVLGDLVKEGVNRDLGASRLDVSFHVVTAQVKPLGPWQ